MTNLKWTKGLSVFLFMQGTRHTPLHRCSYRGQRSIRENWELLEDGWFYGERVLLRSVRWTWLPLTRTPWCSEHQHTHCDSEHRSRFLLSRAGCVPAAAIWTSTGVRAGMGGWGGNKQSGGRVEQLTEMKGGMKWGKHWALKLAFRPAREDYQYKQMGDGSEEMRD